MGVPPLPVEVLPSSTDSLMSLAFARSSPRPDEDGATLRIDDWHLMPRTGRLWFQREYEDVRWAYFGSNDWISMDTTRTSTLRAMMQAYFGEPTHTLAESRGPRGNSKRIHPIRILVRSERHASFDGHGRQWSVRARVGRCYRSALQGLVARYQADVAASHDGGGTACSLRRLLLFEGSGDLVSDGFRWKRFLLGTRGLPGLDDRPPPGTIRAGRPRRAIRTG